jgi:hypothetical protein
MLGAMTLRLSLVAVATSLVLAACGGSSHGSSTAASATGAASSQTGTEAATRSATPTTTSSASAPPEVPKKARKEQHHGGSRALSQGAHVKSNVAIGASGDVSPPVVSVPSGVGIELHVTNHGSSAATVALGSPAHPSVHVAPGGTRTVHTGGLQDGTYRILVNGTPRAQLMIGAQGGP